MSPVASSCGDSISELIHAGNCQELCVGRQGHGQAAGHMEDDLAMLTGQPLMKVAEEDSRGALGGWFVTIQAACCCQLCACARPSALAQHPALCVVTDFVGVGKQVIVSAFCQECRHKLCRHKLNRLSGTVGRTVIPATFPCARRWPYAGALETPPRCAHLDSCACRLPLRPVVGLQVPLKLRLAQSALT
jgi:hypothetical protein